MGDQKERQIVVFFLHVNGEKVEFGVSIDKVQEINKMMEITRLPQTPEFIRGIASLRGKIIPIIDLKLRLNMETDTHYYDDAHIVVLEIGQHRTGVTVIGTHTLANCDTVTSHPGGGGASHAGPQICKPEAVLAAPNRQVFTSPTGKAVVSSKQNNPTLSGASNTLFIS
jgi:chemotaxis signal transduction protein